MNGRIPDVKGIEYPIAWRRGDVQAVDLAWRSERTSGIAQPVPATGSDERPEQEKVRPNGAFLHRAGSNIGNIWPLFIILPIQAGFSLSLVWLNTAFTDEALYLHSGHLEIEHWLHGTPIPAFPTYFSGAPVLYPPLGALADSAGGLAGARILSLCFMLCTTSILWFTASRLYGKLTGTFAAALFGVLGPTLRLGAFATFDAMSLCLIAFASYCVVRAARQRREAGWLVAAALALAMANATKYASVLFDPVVAGLLFLLASQLSNWRDALARSCLMTGYVSGILVFLLSLGGGEYLTGMEQTTLTRLGNTDPVRAVISQSWQLTAAILVLATGAVVLALAVERTWPCRALPILLASAALLVPAEQARIHTLTSLSKHVDFGAWFAAIGAGYLIGWVIKTVRPRWLRWMSAGACVCVIVFPARVGFAQARAIFKSWSNSSAMITTLHDILPKLSGPILFDNNQEIPEYYLPLEGDQWYRWSSYSDLRLPGGRSVSGVVGRDLNPSLYAQKISTGYFSVVVLNFSSAAVLDRYLIPALRNNPHYYLTALVPYGGRVSQIWAYEPQKNFSEKELAPTGGSGLVMSLLHPVALLRPILGSVESAVIDSGAVVFLLIVLIRFSWRRGKACDEI
jgi:4-amino-4-deoxy-L-arabinose transferase-like glycosyltransferase